jgi:hypothetical protein
VVEVSAVCTEDRKILISYFLCGNPQNNFSPHKAWKNLGLEAVKWKIVAKVGGRLLQRWAWMLYILCLQMRNISARHCLYPLRFLIFVSERADEPVSRAKHHVALRKIVAQLLGRRAQSQLREVRISAKCLVEMFPFPS